MGEEGKHSDSGACQLGYEFVVLDWLRIIWINLRPQTLAIKLCTRQGLEVCHLGQDLVILDTALEATHGQFDGFFSQFPYKCHLEVAACVGD